MGIDAQKREAARKALDFVDDGMRLGLGTGSTAWHFVDLLGERVRDGLNVVCVPTSNATGKQAEELNIPLSTLDETQELDLTVDGADEIDPQLNLIKGGGGAHLREKIVASRSNKLIIIADKSKLVNSLGKFPLPLEITPFGSKAVMQSVISVCDELGLAGEITQRSKDNGRAFYTDNGNLVFDCLFHQIKAPDVLAGQLSKIPGMVEHGLFIKMASAAIIANENSIDVKYA